MPVGPTTVALRAGAPGAVSARRTVLNGREIILATCDAEVRSGTLSPADGDTIAAAADHARTAERPLVVEIESGGADVAEGLAASVGWGLAARAISRCSGVVPVLMSVTGPAVAGPAL
ncbi:MAG: carboxyl transferase domain-containing protein, partial [Acidimicrobiales bacterium]